MVMSGDILSWLLVQLLSQVQYMHTISYVRSLSSHFIMISIQRQFVISLPMHHHSPAMREISASFSDDERHNKLLFLLIQLYTLKPFRIGYAYSEFGSVPFRRLRLKYARRLPTGVIRHSESVPNFVAVGYHS